MKVLNLYAGIGGNRKLWKDVDVTAVEYNAEIAAIYKEFHPDDTVIVTDAHQYLLDHYKEFDFVWSSPPCPTHSRTNYFLKARSAARYPEMGLWQEIIFLQHHATCKWVVENVISYYEPLIKPQEVGRHYFWSNFNIPPFHVATHIGSMEGKSQNERRALKQKSLGYNLTDKGLSCDLRRRALNNCVNPELGLFILEQARGVIRELSVTNNTLFH